MTGQLIADRYKVLKTLGAGSIANTYLTQDLQPSDRPTCVIKQLVTRHPDPKLLTAKKHLFAEEATSLQRLGEHSQIPQRLDYFEHQEATYLVEEFVDGHPLTQELAQGKRWPKSRVIQFLKDMLHLLTFVHSQGVIHRDVKPSNIMRRQSDHQLVLIDFGAAQTIPAGRFSETRTNVIVGTPGYMPVEQARGRAKPSSDLYALGMIALQAVTGISPKHLQDNEQGEWIWRPYADVSDELAIVLNQLVRYQHRHRFQSAGEALAAVQSLALATDATVGDRPSCATHAPAPYGTTPDSTRDLMLGMESTEVIMGSPSPRRARPQHDYRQRAKSRPMSLFWRPLPTLVGAAAIVMTVALPGIANRVQTLGDEAQAPQRFNPQNLSLSQFDRHAADW